MNCVRCGSLVTTSANFVSWPRPEGMTESVILPA
jgi:hypothetical protein